jgi:hypothetical protein
VSQSGQLVQPDNTPNPLQDRLVPPSWRTTSREARLGTIAVILLVLRALGNSQFAEE